MNELTIRPDDFFINPTTRIPVCLVLDVSPSMSGQRAQGAPAGTVGVPIDELNAGVKQFYREVGANADTRYACEIAVVSFSSKGALVRDFEVAADAQAPTLALDMKVGGTSIGSAMSMAMDLVEARKTLYRAAGVEYFQPWIVLMTDGFPTDQSHQTAAPRVAEQVRLKKLVMFPIGIGGGADMETLKLFSPTRPPLRLQGLKFEPFFAWLGASVVRVSHSNPTEDIKLDMEGLKGWAVL